MDRESTKRLLTLIKGKDALSAAVMIGRLAESGGAGPDVLTRDAPEALAATASALLGMEGFGGGDLPAAILSALASVLYASNAHGEINSIISLRFLKLDMF